MGMLLALLLRSLDLYRRWRVSAFAVTSVGSAIADNFTHILPLH